MNQEIKNQESQCRTIAEEYALAKKEGRQPISPYCDKPLEIAETQYVYIKWRWDDKKKEYVKDDKNGDAEAPYCMNCDARDWDFIDEVLANF